MYMTNFLVVLIGGKTKSIARATNKTEHNAYFSCSGGIKFPYLKFQGFQGVHYLNFQGLKVFTT